LSRQKGHYCSLISTFSILPKTILCVSPLYHFSSGSLSMKASAVKGATYCFLQIITSLASSK